MLKTNLKSKIKGDDRLNLYEQNQIKHKKIIENESKIIAMQKEGKNTKEIAKEMGVSHATIYYFLIHHHIIEKKRGERIPYARRRKNESEKKLKPFMERISPELKAIIKRNTAMNNGRIKTYTNPPKDEEDRERELVDNIIEMEITDVVTKTRSKRE